MNIHILYIMYGRGYLKKNSCNWRITAQVTCLIGKFPKVNSGFCCFRLTLAIYTLHISCIPGSREPDENSEHHSAKTNHAQVPQPRKRNPRVVGFIHNNSIQKTVILAHMKRILDLVLSVFNLYPRSPLLMFSPPDRRRRSRRRTQSTRGGERATTISQK